MTVTSIGFGETSTGLSVTSGNTLDVLNGGTIIATVVSSGGTENVSAAGFASASVVSGGGYENVSSGGTAVGTLAISGGYQRIFASGTASATVTSSGGYQVVSAAGTAIGTHAMGGGHVVVSAGGTATHAVVGSGGNEVVSSGGAASNTTVSGGGFEFVSAGGTASGTVVSSGGYQVVSSGGTASDTLVNDGGQEQVVLSGMDLDTTVNGGGFEYVSSGGTATGAVVNGGGHEIVSAGGSIVGATIEGGTLELLNADTSDVGAITFGAAGQLIIDAGTPANIISNFQLEDSVDFRAFDPSQTSASISVSGGSTQINGVEFAAIFPATGPGSLDLQPDGGGGTLVTLACFAAGTRILSDCGELPVERLRVGDRVATLHGKRLASVRWIGFRHLAPVPDAAQPLRIAARAFGEGLPWRDVLLSPEHAVYAGGVLIPVRHLINGNTIRREQVSQMTYYHLELDRHDVLLAGGLPCESYLDTGNRSALFERVASNRRVVGSHLSGSRIDT
jgi:autotransporter passenger strand-loop-strand repeat protein